MAWKLFGSRDGKPRPPINDKFAAATRQRRMLTAQQRVDTLPAFAKLERNWCNPPTAYELDGRYAELADPSQTRRWPDVDSLAAALRTASEAAPAGTVFAMLRDEAEARWLEARLGDLLAVLATAVPTMQAGAAVLAEDRALVVDVEDGAVVTLFGDWPPELVTALTS